MLNSLYLEDRESKGMSQEVYRLKNSLPVVSVQVHAAEDVQLGVDPVQPAFDQICRVQAIEDQKAATFYQLEPENDPNEKL